MRLLHGHRPAARARTRSSSTPATGIEELEADFVVLATGSRPRVPDWAAVDGERILTTRQAYPPPRSPSTCASSARASPASSSRTCSARSGSKVSLVVSRQQVLPLKDAEVAAVLEDEFLARGVQAAQGRAGEVRSTRDRRRRARRLRRRPRASTRRTWCSRSGRSRTPRTSGSTDAGVETRRRRLRRRQPQLPVERRRTSTPPATCRGSCRCRRWPRCRAARSPSTSWGCTTGRTATSTTRRRRRRSSPSPRSPTSGSPRPRRSRRAARSG